MVLMCRVKMLTWHLMSKIRRKRGKGATKKTATKKRPGRRKKAKRSKKVIRSGTRLMSVQQVADAIGISTARALQLFNTPVEEGGLNGFKVGILWRCSVEEFDRWVKEQEANA